MVRLLSKSFISEEIKKRTLVLKKNLLKNNIDACLIVEKVDFFYYTGTTVEGFIYIEPEKEPLLFDQKAYWKSRD